MTKYLKEEIKETLIEDALEIYNEPIELSSGIKSNVFIDCTKVLSHARSYAAIVDLFYYSIAWETEYIGGPATGAIPIACGVALDFLKAGEQMNWFYTKEKNNKTVFCGQIDISPKTTVIVEDVITSGQSVLRCIETAEQQGLKVIQVLALVDREMGGFERIKEKVPNTSAFFKLSDLTGNINIQTSS